VYLDEVPSHAAPDPQYSSPLAPQNKSPHEQLGSPLISTTLNAAQPTTDPEDQKHPIPSP
jgi:hypothetical protein